MMPYPKDAVGLQPPNFTVDSVSYCIQCENTGNKYNFISTCHVMLNCLKIKEQLQHFYFNLLFYTKDIQGRYRLNAPTFVNQKKVFSKKENLSMTLISRHSILSLQPTQFPFMYGLKQSVRWTAYKYLIS